MEAKAIHYGAQCAPRKVRLLRGLVVGKTVYQALAVLSAEKRSGSVPTLKLIHSALAQFPKETEINQVIVSDLIVNEGPRRRMFMPRAQGRATPIIKRTSHLTIRLKLNNRG